MARKPKGFRTGHDDSLACPHRDVSVCRKCATQYAEIVEVYGRHYWIADVAERRALFTERKTDGDFKCI